MGLGPAINAWSDNIDPCLFDPGTRPRREANKLKEFPSV